MSTGSPENLASKRHSPGKGTKAPYAADSRTGAGKIQDEPRALEVPEMKNAPKKINMSYGPRN